MTDVVVLSLAYEGLTRIDASGDVAPAAAESWEFSADGRRLTFHLREGLTYSDGSPLTAERFRAAALRTCDRSPRASSRACSSRSRGARRWRPPWSRPADGTPAAPSGRRGGADRLLRRRGPGRPDGRDPPAGARPLLPGRRQPLGLLPGQGGADRGRRRGLVARPGQPRRQRPVRARGDGGGAADRLPGQRAPLGRPAEARRYRLRLHRRQRPRRRGLPAGRRRHRVRRPWADPGDRGGPDAWPRVPPVPAGQHAGDLLQPAPGAFRRPERARGVRLRLRPGDLVRRGPQRRLPPDDDLDPGGDPWPRRRRHLRLRP
jgi:hypothetical protein